MDDLRKATCEAIQASGVELLRAPQRFVGYVTDVIDPESMEARVLYAGCDADYIGYFGDALGGGTTGALSTAVERAADHLNAQYVIDANLARKVSWEIAAGVADFLGVGAPQRPVTETAQLQVKAQAAQTTAVPATPPAVSAAPQVQPRPAPQLTQDVSVGGYVSNQPGYYQQVPTPQSEPLGWSTGGQPQPAQTYAPAPAPVKKKSHGVTIAVVAGLVVGAIIVVVALGGLMGGRGGSQQGTEPSTQTYTDDSVDDTTDTSDTTDTTDTSDTSDVVETPPVDTDPDEGTIDALRFSQMEVSDSYYGDMKAVFIHNNGYTPLAVASVSGDDYIEAIDPGKDGFFLMDRDDAILDDVYTYSPGSNSVASYLTWTETRTSDAVTITVHNSSDTALSFDTIFYFVAYDGSNLHYWRTDWTNDSTGETTTTIQPGDNTFNVTGERDSVFDMSYDLYINGVRIDRG